MTGDKKKMETLKKMLEFKEKTVVASDNCIIATQDGEVLRVLWGVPK